MNKSRNKILIIMPTAFRFGWMGSTQRIFHISYALKSIGYQVALFAAAPTSPNIQRKIDDQYPGHVFRADKTGPYPQFLDGHELLRRMCRMMWKIRGKNYYFGKASYGWAESLNLDNICNILHSQKFNPSLIWGVSTGYLDGPVLANDLAKKLGIPWVMEMQDPPQGAGIGTERPAVSYQYKRLLAEAHKIITTSYSYEKNLIEVYGLNERDVSALHLTYEGSLEKKIVYKSKGPINFLYAGDLSSGRCLKGFAKGLYESLRVNPNLMELVHVDIIGDGQGFYELEALTKELAISKLFHFHGKRNKEFCDKYSRQANVFIVMQTNETSKMQIPGKIFNYLKHLKPILGLMPDCEAAEILLKSGLGVVHEADDINDIAKSISEICSQHELYSLNLSPNINYIENFSSNALREKLSMIIKDVMQGNWV